MGSMSFRINHLRRDDRKVIVVLEDGGEVQQEYPTADEADRAMRTVAGLLHLAIVDNRVRFIPSFARDDLGTFDVTTFVRA